MHVDSAVVRVFEVTARLVADGVGNIGPAMSQRLVNHLHGRVHALNHLGLGDHPANGLRVLLKLLLVGDFVLEGEKSLDIQIGRAAGGRRNAGGQLGISPGGDDAVIGFAAQPGPGGHHDGPQVSQRFCERLGRRLAALCLGEFPENRQPLAELVQPPSVAVRR